MKKPIIIIVYALAFTLLFSCKKDDSVTCTTCNSPDTLNFEICKETDGNASINGENTGVSYDLYIIDLQESGARCGN